MATLLISDVIRFEIQAETTAREPQESEEPQESRESVDRDPPDPVTLRKRLHHALRFVAHDLDGPAADALIQGRPTSRGPAGRTSPNSCPGPRPPRPATGST